MAVGEKRGEEKNPNCSISVLFYFVPNIFE
jgi:hypothetical protein